MDLNFFSSENSNLLLDLLRYQTQIFRYPRIGAFEVYVNKGRVRKQVFSKLAAGKWPNAQWLWDRIGKGFSSSRFT